MTKRQAEALVARVEREDPQCSAKRLGNGGVQIADTRTGCTAILWTPEDWERRKLDSLPEYHDVENERKEAAFDAELTAAGFACMGRKSFDTYCRERRRGHTPERARHIMLGGEAPDV